VIPLVMVNDHQERAFRYVQLAGEIAPALADCMAVISGRYVPSVALDIMREVEIRVLWQIHAQLPAPDLAVILTADSRISAHRILDRGLHSQWQADPRNASREIDAYRRVASRLRRTGWPIPELDTTKTASDQIARSNFRTATAQPRLDRNVVDRDHRGS
jgi:dTMP kinase